MKHASICRCQFGVLGRRILVRIKQLKKERFTLLRVLQFVYDKFTEFETHVVLSADDALRGRKALKELEYVALKSVNMKR